MPPFSFPVLAEAGRGLYWPDMWKTGPGTSSLVGGLLRGFRVAVDHPIRPGVHEVRSIRKQVCGIHGALLSLVLFAVADMVMASAPASAVNGIWLDPEKGGYIQIYEDHGNWHGIVVGSTDGNVKNDDNNPDPAQRGLTLLGKPVIRNLVYDGKGRWRGGTIYNPLDGRTYSVSLSLADENTLEVRGYIGMPLLGQTRRWVRVTDPAAPGLQSQALIQPLR